MDRQLLNKNWTLQGESIEGIINATVPGSIYFDLISAGQMEEPFFRDNEYEALKRMEKDYIYECTFSVEQHIFEQDSILLSFESLDTLAEITLNGVKLGTTENMHRIYEFEVKPYLKKIDNLLSVTIFSALSYIKKCHQKIETIGCIDAIEGFPQLRKAHSMFGWDWGPRIPEAGEKVRNKNQIM